jgi:hypothetical protein
MPCCAMLCCAEGGMQRVCWVAQADSLQDKRWTAKLQARRTSIGTPITTLPRTNHLTMPSHPPDHHHNCHCTAGTTAPATLSAPSSSPRRSAKFTSSSAQHAKPPSQHSTAQQATQTMKAATIFPHHHQQQHQGPVPSGSGQGGVGLLLRWWILHRNLGTTLCWGLCGPGMCTASGRC